MYQKGRYYHEVLDLSEKIILKWILAGLGWYELDLSG
jgi:hypothetical protein